MKSVVLLSGGLDSTVALALSVKAGASCFPLAFHYGQRHDEELRSARRIASFYKTELATFQVEFPGGKTVSSLFRGAEKGIPKDRRVEDALGQISSTYVGCRNAVFLSLAASYAEALDADSIVTGFNCNDARGYPVPDGRIEFVKAMELAILLGSKRGIEGRPITIECPLIDKSKVDTVRLARDLKVPIHLTRSCFEDGDRPCQRCDACRIRAEAFSKAGIADAALTAWNPLGVKVVKKTLRST